jgi:hypothetical protein
MKNILFVFTMMMLLTEAIWGQTVLTSGDIAIVGFNFDDPDEFAFVLLTDITSNTSIRFTDCGWLSSGSFRTGEGGLEWISSSQYSQGTVIYYSAVGGEWSVNSAQLNSNSTTNILLSASGDQLIAFQGSATDPTILYAVNSEGSAVWQSDATSANTSALPTGLANGTSAIALDEIDNSAYTGGPYSDMSLLRSAIGSTSNWTGNDASRVTMPTSPLPVELTSFTAVTKGRGVELAWRTATEVNNYGFEIERMGLNHRSIGSLDQWSKIGFVEGHGTTNAPKSYSFIDGSASGTVAYRLKQIDRDGSFEYSNQVEVTIAAPKEFVLMQNHPNPFNPATSIYYTLPLSGFVTLKVYGMLGKEVATLVNGMQDAGVHIVKFSAGGGSAFGGDASQLPSGIYFYTLRTNSFSATRKMILVK